MYLPCLSRIVLRQPGKLAVQSPMGLGDLPRAREEESLRRIENRKIGVTPGVVTFLDGKDGTGTC